MCVYVCVVCMWCACGVRSVGEWVGTVSHATILESALSLSFSCCYRVKPAKADNHTIE